jgi:hypothetical protein
MSEVWGTGIGIHSQVREWQIASSVRAQCQRWQANAERPTARPQIIEIARLAVESRRGNKKCKQED